MKISFKDYKKNEVLKMLREWTGLSQKDFGKLVGKEADTVLKYEKGIINYSLDTLLIIADKYDLDINISSKSKRTK